MIMPANRKTRKVSTCADGIHQSQHGIACQHVAY